MVRCPKCHHGHLEDKDLIFVCFECGGEFLKCLGGKKADGGETDEKT